MIIISGGQTGIDRIALEVARELGFKTGGFAPDNYMTENGPDFSLIDFNLIAIKGGSYKMRTKENVVQADAVVLFGDTLSPGTAFTLRICENFKKPYICNPNIKETLYFIKNHNPTYLMIAGNRLSKITNIVMQFYESIFKSVLAQYKNGLL